MIVEAETDERACDQALREVNTWRAISALPTIGRGGVGSRPASQVAPDAPPITPTETPNEPDVQVGRIVKHGTVIDLVELRIERNNRLRGGIVLDALRDALERRGA